MNISRTAKGVNFYGPKSEYVVSGSDCGNIFFWDKATEAIVQCMPGDEKGVVSARRQTVNTRYRHQCMRACISCLLISRRREVACFSEETTLCYLDGLYDN